MIGEKVVKLFMQKIMKRFNIVKYKFKNLSTNILIFFTLIILHFTLIVVLMNYNFTSIIGYSLYITIILIPFLIMVLVLFDNKYVNYLIKLR